MNATFPPISRWLAVVGIALAVSGCSQPTTTENKVEVDDNYFEVEGQSSTHNASASAKVADTYSFTNEGARDHTVTIHRPPDGIDITIMNDVLNPGESTQITFDKAGTYHIWCRYHGNMTERMHITFTVSM